MQPAVLRIPASRNVRNDGDELVKRPWKSRLIELALWAALSVAVAVVMIHFADRLLPGTNF
jgi:hypothetical protein